MNPLQAKIYEAQRDAGERVVLAHLEQSGLIVKTEAEKLAEARSKARAAAHAAEAAWRQYAGELEDGDKRTQALTVADLFQFAMRVS